jgi:hypothetical protein
MKDFARMLLGKDLRSIAGSNAVVKDVNGQVDFDALFTLIFHHERMLVMRAADAVEKITRVNPQFLKPHKVQLMSLLTSAVNKELKWHVAQLVPRLDLVEAETQEVWSILSYWSKNPNESKIVRVNALQGLYEMTQRFSFLKKDLEETIHALEKEPIPSLRARIKKLKKELSRG